MRFVFISAIRVAPERWIAWRRHVNALFARGAAMEGFTCHDGLRPEVMIAAGGAARADDMGQVLAALKAQDLYHKALPALGGGDDGSAHLILLKSGELCRVDLVDMPDTAAPTEQDETQTNIIAWQAALQDQIRATLPGICAKLAAFMPEGATPAQLIIPERCAIHTLMPYDAQNASECATVARFFALEGLDLDEQNAAPGPFAPGWSFSALACTDQMDIGLFAAVVMRVQCVWYQQRGQRDFCINQTSLLAKRETVETDITTSHEVVRRLFDFTVWEHELREFSANLKPWLKSAFDALHRFWDMAEESAYIEKTLKQSHELLASGYQSRLLIQERQQSRLLFVIAAIGLLGIAGSLMSIWTALRWGNLVPEGYWASETGSAIVLGIIMANAAVLVVVLARFFATQFK